MSAAWTGTERWLLVRGPRTVLRLALPRYGSISIGRADTSAIRLEEAGVAGEHAVLFLDDGVGVRVLDADSALIKGGALGRGEPGPEVVPAMMSKFRFMYSESASFNRSSS